MGRPAVRVGLIGCGNISGVYIPQVRKYRMLDLVACADLDMERARTRATEYAIPQVYRTEELLADPHIDVVLNLTVPAAHADIARAAIAAGKHVYNEKPLALSREDGRSLLRQAQAANLRVACAPDTFLGAGLATCRKLIDDGWIGEPIAATAFMTGHGPESWHPDPSFLYQAGAGPLFDMGPYYLTALAVLLGPVRRVTGSARISFPERTITSAPLYGTVIKVTTPTHIAGVLDFANGAVGTLITSFDVWAAELPCIEIYGMQGTLSVPDPNMVGGPVRIRRAGAEAWSEVPLLYPFIEHYTRGMGVADLATAVLTGRPHRASGDLAYHVLDIMHALLEASTQGRHIDLQSGCPRPAPLPLGLLPYEVDD
jgi:predicted dehydrogenase